jgi:hypothetical protein
MIIRRKHTVNFAVIPNATSHDDCLSAEALGILVYLLSKPSDWVVSIVELRKRFSMGRDRLYHIMHMLEHARYVVRSQGRKDDSKRFCPVEYIVHDCPVGTSNAEEVVGMAQPTEPLPEKPYPENQEAENPHKKPLPCLPYPAQSYPENQDTY